MNKKITLQDIIEGLIQKHSMERKDAEAFVKGMFDLIEDTLSTEKIVKIKGLGTFKLIEVDSRESINVNSGERFRIEGHSKVSFIPDTSLKNIINKPFSHFETVILNENTKLEDTDVVVENPSVINSDESSEDIQNDNTNEQVSDKPEVAENESAKDINEESATSDETPEFNINPTIEEEAVDNTAQPAEAENIEEMADDTKEEDFIVPTPNIETTEKEPAAEEPTEEQAIEEPAAEEQEAAVADTITTINDRYQDSERITVEPSKPVQEDKKNKRLNIILYIAIAIIIGFACLLFYFLNDNSSSVSEVKEKPVVVADTVKAVTDTAVAAMPASEDSIKKEIKQEEDAVEKEREISAKTEIKAEPQKPEIKEETPKASDGKVYDETIPYKISGTKATHTIQEGEGLMRISLEYYGTKKLYTYILEYNKSAIGENGDKIRMGMKIKIPELKPLK